MRWYCAVFEADLSSIDTTQKTVNLIRLSFTAGAASMADGLTCPETLVPFPTSYADHETSGLTLSGDRCGDKDGRGVTVDPNPITDTDCGTGYWYDPVYRGTGCTSNPCDVSTPGSGDHSICCTNTQPGHFYIHPLRTNLFHSYKGTHQDTYKGSNQGTYWGTYQGPDKDSNQDSNQDAYQDSY